jgi:hypothetical protein
MKILTLILAALLAGCGGVEPQPDFKAGGATVKCEPQPCGKGA